MEFIKRDELNNLIKFEDVFRKTKRAYQLFSQSKRFRYASNMGLYPEIKNHQLGWWIFICLLNLLII